MTYLERRRIVDKARVTTKRYRRRRDSNSAGALAQRKHRQKQALLRELGIALVDVGRLGAWDEANFKAIEAQIPRLIADYLNIVKTYDFDPLDQGKLQQFFDWLNSTEPK